MKIAAPFVVVSILIFSLFLLYHTLRQYSYRDLVEHLHTYTAATIVFAFLLTAANYLILSVYDVLALRYVKKSLSYRKTFFASFLSYVFSYNIGLSLFGSSALRYRYYSAWGLEPEVIARIIAFCVSTFWLGLAVMGGTALILEPPAISAIPVWGASSRIVGCALVGVVGVYLASCFIGTRDLKIRSFSIGLPRFRIAIAQTLAASADWFLAGLVLYVLLPEGRPGFPAFIAVFIISQFAGATSHIPGGLGVFESVIMLTLSPYMQSDSLFGALIVYRGVYYLAPLCVAAIAFIARECYASRNAVAAAANRTFRILSGFIPDVLSLAVFLSGSVLIFSGATPAINERLLMLDPFIPIQLLEASHFIASILGLALLVVADALRRRVDAAYYLSLLLLVAGATSSILKGLDWEEALVLSTVFVFLLPARKLFNRRAALLSRPLRPNWAIAVIAVVAGSIWLGLFSYKNVEYSHDLWWVFELKKNAPRFLRASLGLTIGAIIIAFRSFFALAPHVAELKLEDCESDVRRILSAAKASSANLALLRDKFFFFSEKKDAFLMYGVNRRTIVVMGDPVGEEQSFHDLLWDFYETARGQGARLAWYEISPEYLTIFLEFGAKIYKFGEEASVNLEDFSLSGTRVKHIRASCNKLAREGYRFEVLAPSEASSRLEELRIISDEWCSEKNGKEKGFSLGFFDAQYLANFPFAVVSKGEKIIAFANVWSSGGKEELSVDLMRYAREAPGGTMEFLFIQTMLWGKENGYQKFNLGMAPLSGVEARKSAPIWNKAVTLIFRNGEGIYNFQGLRAFKNKFSPDWSPRYIAISSESINAVGLIRIAVDITRLVGRTVSPLPDRKTQPEA